MCGSASKSMSSADNSRSLQETQKVFDFDEVAGGDKVIDQDEWNAFLAELEKTDFGLKDTKNAKTNTNENKSLEDLFKKNAGKDNELNADEFDAFKKAFKSDKNLDVKFSDIDTSGDGRISMNELEDFIGSSSSKSLSNSLSLSSKKDEKPDIPEKKDFDFNLFGSTDFKLEDAFKFFESLFNNKAA